MSKKEQLQWLMNNIENIEIREIYPEGFSGTPTLLIEISDWDLAENSPYKVEDYCIIFE